MPNRLRVIRVLTQDVLGAHQWNGIRGECVTMPTANHDLVEAAMAGVLERIARAVDWPRLLREASWRHEEIHPDEPAEECIPAAGVCGDCLAEALLADDRGAPDWEAHPVSPRTHEQTDWPAAVAANLAYRDKAHWHSFQASAQPT